MKLSIVGNLLAGSVRLLQMLVFATIVGLAVHYISACESPHAQELREQGWK